jgi:hypothetical protein
MAHDFQPTPQQTGHAIGMAVASLTERLSGGVDGRWLKDAGITLQQYQAELLLLSAAAAMHTIESSGLPPETETAVAAGLFDWVRTLPTGARDLLLRSLDEATDTYAQAAASDEGHPTPMTDVAELEAAFGDRLLNLGENSEVRGTACVRLCLVIPKALWPAQCASGRQMLVDALLLLHQ